MLIEHIAQLKREREQIAEWIAWDRKHALPVGVERIDNANADLARRAELILGHIDSTLAILEAADAQGT